MNYSVYIIQDRTKTNQALFDDLAGDTSFGTHIRNAAANFAADTAGANILDPYATDKVLGKNGIAIRGDMISSVSIKSELVKKDMFVNGTTRVDKFLMTTITVKGSLFAPSLIEMASATIKNKDMAKVAAWASLLPVPAPTDDPNNNYSGDVDDGDAFKLNPTKQRSYGNNYAKFYYRRVLVAVYSDKDTQFRAILHDKVFVSSYEEIYDDKDGNGKFTLVMQCVGASAFDVFVAGPTYKLTVISVTDQISSAAQKHTKTAEKVVETVDRVAGTSISDDVKKYTKKIDSVAETADSLKADDSITIDNLVDNTDKQAETFHPTDMQDAIAQAAKYQEAYGALTDAQKATLANVPGFDQMSLADKMKYIKQLTGK